MADPRDNVEYKAVQFVHFYVPLIIAIQEDENLVARSTMLTMVKNHMRTNAMNFTSPQQSKVIVRAFIAEVMKLDDRSQMGVRIHKYSHYISTGFSVLAALIPYVIAYGASKRSIDLEPEDFANFKASTDAYYRDEWHNFAYKNALEEKKILGAQKTKLLGDFSKKKTVLIGDRQNLNDGIANANTVQQATGEVTDAYLSKRTEIYERELNAFLGKNPKQAKDYISTELIPDNYNFIVPYNYEFTTGTRLQKALDSSMWDTEASGLTSHWLLVLLLVGGFIWTMLRWFFRKQFPSPKCLERFASEMIIQNTDFADALELQRPLPKLPAHDRFSSFRGVVSQIICCCKGHRNKLDNMVMQELQSTQLLDPSRVQVTNQVPVLPGTQVISQVPAAQLAISLRPSPADTNTPFKASGRKKNRSSIHGIWDEPFVPETKPVQFVPVLGPKTETQTKAAAINISRVANLRNQPERKKSPEEIEAEKKELEELETRQKNAEKERKRLEEDRKRLKEQLDQDAKDKEETRLREEEAKKKKEDRKKQGGTTEVITDPLVNAEYNEWLRRKNLTPEERKAEDDLKRKQAAAHARAAFAEKLEAENQRIINAAKQKEIGKLQAHQEMGVAQPSPQQVPPQTLRPVHVDRVQNVHYHFNQPPSEDEMKTLSQIPDDESQSQTHNTEPQSKKAKTTQPPNAGKRRKPAEGPAPQQEKKQRQSSSPTPRKLEYASYDYELSAMADPRNVERVHAQNRQTYNYTQTRTRKR